MKGNDIFIMAGIALGFAVIIGLSLFYLQTEHNVSIVGDSIYMTKHAEQSLDNIYTKYLEYEVPACLGGSIDDNEIVIRAVEPAEIVKSNETSVTYIKCPTTVNSYQTVGTIHNHPSGSCRLSTQDIETYADDMTRGQHIIGLQCKRGYVFYVLEFLDAEVIER